MFPPEIIYTELLRHYVIQTLVVLGNVVDVAVVADGLEVPTGTFDFAFLRTSEQRALKVISLGLSHKIDVLHASFPEGYCPVGIVLAHWRVDIEAVWQLGIDNYVIFVFQGFGKVLLCTHAVEYHKVVERLVRLQGVHTLATFQSRCFCLIM